VQISEWEAYDKIDPIGTWRDDFRMANLMSHITNIVNALYATKGNQATMVNPMDFMPDWAGDRPKVKKQSVEEMKEIFLAIAKDQNARVKKEKEIAKTLNRPPAIFLKRQKEAQERARLMAENKEKEQDRLRQLPKRKVKDSPKENQVNLITEPKTITRHGYRKPDSNAGSGL
jgi:hypothetical protein